MKLLRNAFASLALASLALSNAPAASAAASAERIPAPTAPTSGLLIAQGRFGGILEIESHEARVTVHNGIAVTTVDQVFRNKENRIVEALYTFPVPKKASVANFSMWIGGKEMVGEVVEKQRARQIYESYKRRGIDPGLLEQVDYKAFEMRIFPIAANAAQRVRITYYQELDVDGDVCTYTYPLATNTRPDIDAQVHGRFSLSLDVQSDIPIREMRSPSHRDDFVMVTHADSYVEASLEATRGDLKRDVVVSWKQSRANTGVDTLTSNPKGEDGYVMLTLTAGDELEPRDDGRDFIFVSDISGSMAHDGKLGASQASVRAFLDTLSAKDRFDLISFNVSAKTLFDELHAVDEQSLSQAAVFLNTQSARGSTRLRPALETAYRYLDKDRPLHVVLLSDGMTEKDEYRELLALVKRRPAGVRVFCIGVGNDINRPLLEQIAKRTGGLASFISRGDDFASRAKAFRRKLTRPAIADLTLSHAGSGLYDIEPRKMPNLYHGSPLRIYARYKKAGRVKITLRGTIDGAPAERSYHIDLEGESTSTPEIERMWAYKRVQRLLADGHTRGSNATHRDEIVSLCESYSIPSEFASFLVLENDAEYREWKIERRNANRLARDRQAQAKLRTKLEAMRDQSARQIGPAALRDAVAANPKTRRTDAPRQQRRQQTPATQRAPNGDRGKAGGAIDPWTLLLAIVLAAIGIVSYRRETQRAR